MHGKWRKKMAWLGKRSDSPLSRGWPVHPREGWLAHCRVSHRSGPFSKEKSPFSSVNKYFLLIDQWGEAAHGLWSKERDFGGSALLSGSSCMEKWFSVVVLYFLCSKGFIHQKRWRVGILSVSCMCSWNPHVYLFIYMCACLHEFTCACRCPWKT